MSATPGKDDHGSGVPLARKIRLDSAVYCPHSMRASEGDADCDHDFEATPGLTGPGFAVWTCTKCGRSFRYEVWDYSHRRLS